MIRAALLAIFAAGAVQAQERAETGTGAVLRGLDKVSGETADFTFPAGGTSQIFGLDVEMVECRFPADNPSGDAAAYLVIWTTDARDPVFRGWMLASAPALNALDNRRYDVWVLRCITS